jgi:hypothetical protein
MDSVLFRHVRCHLSDKAAEIEEIRKLYDEIELLSYIRIVNAAAFKEKEINKCWQLKRLEILTHLSILSCIQQYGIDLTIDESRILYKGFDKRTNRIGSKPIKNGLTVQVMARWAQLKLHMILIL